MAASVLQWLVHQFRVRRRPVVTVAGVQIRVGRHMSPQVERTVSRGRYERDELRLIEQVLSPGDVVLEVGAGIGLVSAYCAKRLGSSRVFAYEANPDLEACIRETYALNQVQPTLEMCAVGADAGKVTLYRSEDLWASSVLRPGGRVRPVEVPVKALSEIGRLVRPTLLIVDTEGGESDLFHRAHLPTVTRIILELHERVIGAASARRVRSSLAAMGFDERPELSAGQHLVLQRAEGQMPTVILNATITCPSCGYQKEEAMPENACVHFWECPQCHVVVTPGPGKCCVFCSHSSSQCPPRQREAGTA